MLDVRSWAERQWPSLLFFDPRLQKIAVNIATAMLTLPSASIPERFSLQKEIKGCYRFLNNKTLSHSMLQQQHYENSLDEARLASGRVLFIQDGSELIYNRLNWTELGPTADSSGNGIMFHSCLAVKCEDGKPQIIGLSGQKAWIRQEGGADAKIQREKESQVWQEMIELIGPAPEGRKWTTVGDRGADIFAFVESLPPGWDCVIRAKHDRQILVKGLKKSLKEYLRGLASKGSTRHWLRARSEPCREVELQFSWAQIDMLPPGVQQDKTSIRGSYVRVWCEEEPEIEWILFTKTLVSSYDEALEIVDIYKQRWLIEEYHKCLKTGCQIEQAQLKTADALLTFFGMLGVIATQLLQLKSISRSHPEELVEKYADKVSIMVLQNIYGLKGPMTVREYWRRIAMLVGFMGRKSDGNPGWQKIWKGWIKLRDLCRGVEIGRQLGLEGA